MTKIRKNILITRIGLLFGTVFIMGISIFLGDDYKYIPLTIGLVWDAAFFIYGAITLKCPFCHKSLLMYFKGSFCPYCGLDIDKESE